MLQRLWGFSAQDLGGPAAGAAQRAAPHQLCPVWPQRAPRSRRLLWQRRRHAHCSNGSGLQVPLWAQCPGLCEVQCTVSFARSCRSKRLGPDGPFGDGGAIRMGLAYRCRSGPSAPACVRSSALSALPDLAAASVSALTASLAMVVPYAWVWPTGAALCPVPRPV